MGNNFFNENIKFKNVKLIRFLGKVNLISKLFQKDNIYFDKFKNDLFGFKTVH